MSNLCPAWCFQLKEGEAERLSLALAVSLVLHGSVLMSLPSGILKSTIPSWPKQPSLHTPLVATLRPELPVRPDDVQDLVVPEEESKRALRERRVASYQPLSESISPAAPATQSSQDSTVPPAPEVPAGLIPGPWYYPARYLHRRVIPLRPIWPAYPLDAAETRGEVVLLLFVSEAGTVDEYRVVKASPQGVFEEMVISAFAAEKYAPGLIAGQPVKGQLLVEVIFEPGFPPQAMLDGLATRSR